MFVRNPCKLFLPEPAPFGLGDLPGGWGVGWGGFCQETVRNAHGFQTENPAPLCSLGLVLSGQGDLPGAIRHYEDALRLRARLGDPYAESEGCKSLGAAYLRCRPHPSQPAPPLAPFAPFAPLAPAPRRAPPAARPSLSRPLTRRAAARSSGATITR